MNEIPNLFLERMQSLLGEEFQQFIESFDQPPLNGLRVNTLKLSSDSFQRKSPFSLAPLPWSPDGFLVPGEVQPGKHPFHAAGLYYLQEPSAMAVAELLDPKPGDRVLDLAAAPGGKSTHMAALMDNQGLLIANEIHPRRVWDLAENLERCGVRNAAILNETPERIATSLTGFFDKILVDAPCSGEAMFRKSQLARKEWSPDLVRGSSSRQGKILACAARMLKPGGTLAYATCTFSPQENEAVIARFLDEHPGFEVVGPSPPPGCTPGKPEWAAEHKTEALLKTVRIWPHRAPGEGHFIAILRNKDASGGGKRSRFSTRTVPGNVLKLFQSFCDRNLVSLPVEPDLVLAGSYLYHRPAGLPALEGLRTIHPGWWLGILKKGRFEPSHSLALGLSTAHAGRKLILDGEEPGNAFPRDLNAYLRGESLYIGESDRSTPRLALHPQFEGVPGQGWVLVTIAGHPLGWGKLVGDVLKNYYPRGLRWL